MTDEQSSPIHLILVDDEEDLVTFMAHRLRKRNMDVSTATSGQQALALATKKKFYDYIHLELSNYYNCKAVFFF